MPTLTGIFDWINAVLGLWLAVSPFILGYSATMVALWNGIIVGVVVIVLADVGRIHLRSIGCPASVKRQGCSQLSG